MDPITHAASGAVAALALAPRPLNRWIVPLAALIAASPDVDVFFAHDPLQFLMLHRGITHALAAVPFMGLAAALCCYPVWRKDATARLSFPFVWVAACCLVLLHIWLDVVTTYGTMIYLPFSYERVRLNGIFIVDFLLTLPLLWAVWRLRARRIWMFAALAWVFVYPSLCVGLNALHAEQTRSRLAAEGQEARQLTVLPDALAPFFWRVLYEQTGPADTQATPAGTQATPVGTRGVYVVEQGLDALGRPRTAPMYHPALPVALAQSLVRQSLACEAFLSFALLPVQSELRHADRPLSASKPAGDAAFDQQREYRIFDLRFGSNLAFVRKIMASRYNGDTPFELMVQFDLPEAAMPSPDWSAARLLRERLRFSGSGGDSQWQEPCPQGPADAVHWILGLRQAEAACVQNRKQAQQ